MKVYLTVLITLIIAGKVYASPAFVVSDSLQQKVTNNGDTEPDGNEVRRQLMSYAVYPLEARAKGLEGKVFLQILFSETGSVTKVKVLEYTNDVFVTPSVEAAYKVRVKPAMEGFKPISFWITVPVRFSLIEDGKINLLNNKVSNDSTFLDFLSKALSAELQRKYRFSSGRKVSGNVTVSLTLETDGEIDDVVVLNSSSEYLRDEISDILEDIETKGGIFPRDNDVENLTFTLNVTITER